MSALTAADVWRDNKIKGDIHSGAHEVDKPEVRRWGLGLETRIGAGVTRRTEALLATVAPTAGNYPLGAVTNDPDPTKNGFWTWSGSEWQFARPFPDTVSVLTELGGTANAVTASTREGVDPAEVVLFIVQPVISNTDDVTLSINGGAALPVRDVNGNELAADLLTAGRLIQLVDNGDEYRLVSDPDADGAAASAAASAAEAAGSISIVAEARDEAEAARDATLAAISSVVPNMFATVVAAEAYAPVAAPEFIQTAGKLASGDGGGAIYKQVASEPAHDGKFSITLDDAVTVVWFEYADTIINVKAFAETSHGADISLAFAAAWECMTERGGGKIWFPHNDGVPYEWNSRTEVEFSGRCSIDGENVVFQIGDNFALDGADWPYWPLVVSGAAPTEISSSVTNMFRNYLKLSAPIAAERGARIYVSDNRAGSKWDVGGNDYRPCHRASVSYSDPDKDIINYYPALSIPAPVANATTGEVTKTDFLFYLYTGDCICHIGGGITWRGVLNPVDGLETGEGAQNPGGASARGIVVQRGVFDVECHFENCWDGIRAVECDIVYHNSRNTGSFNGYGIKTMDKTWALIDNCQLTLSRHGIGIGGSTPDGSWAYVSNCEIGSDRASYDPDLYPADELGAFDTHGNGYEVQIVNCEINGSITVAGDVLRVQNSKIVSRQDRGITEFSPNGRNNGLVEITNCDLYLLPRIRPNDEGDGAGAKTTETKFFSHSTNYDHTGWQLRVRGCRLGVQDAASWIAPAIAYIEPGNLNFEEISFRDCTFEFTGTPVRQVNFNGRSDGGRIEVRGCEFRGCSLYVLSDTSLDNFEYVHIVGNRVLNIDSTTNFFAPDGISVGGDTSISSVTKDVVIRDNHIESRGTGSLVIVAAVPYRLVDVSGNVGVFIASGTLTVGMRTHRNQNIITAYRHIARLKGNVIQNTGAGTITLAYQISGLAAAGSVLEGRYQTGDNVHYAASSGITVTGAAASPV